MVSNVATAFDPWFKRTACSPSQQSWTVHAVRTANSSAHSSHSDAVAQLLKTIITLSPSYWRQSSRREPSCSFPCSEQSAIGQYPEPHAYSPHSLLYNELKIHLTKTNYVLASPNLSRLTFVSIFRISYRSAQPSPLSGLFSITDQHIHLSNFSINAAMAYCCPRVRNQFHTHTDIHVFIYRTRRQ